MLSKKGNKGEWNMNEFCESYLDIINKVCVGFDYDEMTDCIGIKTINDTTKSDVIADINVIVPGKVVEITFADGGKEKMVCHKDDTFDLRKCCFIAIAKHLYKKEYTQEGIEYMATQLTYQKKYVKIVDKALKNYKKRKEDK